MGGSGPSGASAAGPGGVPEPSWPERLAMTESALRELANEISTVRRGLDSSPGGALVASAGPNTEAGPGNRGAGSTGRARLRESPLAPLFRATVEASDDADDRGGAAIVGDASEPLRQAPAGTAVEDGYGSGSWLELGMFEVEPRIARVLASSEQQFGPEHPQTLWAVHDLATALTNAGEVVSAERLATRLVALRSRLLGQHHPHTERAYELRRSVGESRRDGRRRSGDGLS